MKSTFTSGKLAAFSGALALLFALTLMYSITDQTSPTGPITTLIGNLLHSPPSPPTESTLQAVGTFDISEKNIRKLLNILIVLSAFISGVLAVLASKKESSSLWYSLAIACSSAALMQISTLLAVIFMIVCAAVCLKNRKWKMTSR